ncbi:MAG TPA: hypothetical protein VKV26_04235 [Dehalococcoidia bacterium]|nr:hypothetical protein [Dehalococcoidia bacterium]
MATPTESLIQKLESFAGTLSDPEREVLGELLLNSVDSSKTPQDVAGYLLASGPSSLLGGAILGAQASNNTFTRLHLQTAPNNIVLVAAGPRARGQL